MQAYAFMFDDTTRVHLIDTPGFNDTDFTDYEILTEIAFWLSEAYTEKCLLSGIVYLHDIGHTRMTHEGKNNLELFKKLCGPNALSSVVLATTRWDEVPQSIAEQREAELRTTEQFWGGMIAHGSNMVRQVGKPGSPEAHASAHSIIDLILRKGSVVLDIQEEMVNQDKELGDTGAGQELSRERREIEEEWKKKVEESELKMKEALKNNRAENARMMEALKQKQEMKLAQMQTERAIAEEAMKKNYEQLHAVRMETLAKEKNHEMEIIKIKHDSEKPNLLSIVAQHHRMKMEKRIQAHTQQVTHETMKLQHELRVLDGKVEMQKMEEAQKTARYEMEMRAQVQLEETRARVEQARAKAEQARAKAEQARADQARLEGGGCYLM